MAAVSAVAGQTGVTLDDVGATPTQSILVQTGDEVLDYRAAVRFYCGAWQFVRGGGDHAFGDFAAQLPAVLRFAGVSAQPAEANRTSGAPRL